MLASSTSASSTSSGGSASPAGDAVPRLPPSVPRLRIWGEPTVRDASASAGSSAASSPCSISAYVRPGAEPQRPVLARPAAELGHLAEVEDRVGPRAVEVELDHDVGPAADRERARMLGAQHERLCQRARPQHLHPEVLALLAHVRHAESCRRAEPPLPKLVDTITSTTTVITYGSALRNSGVTCTS